MSEDDGPERAEADLPDMTRERARSERRNLDMERGEPVSGTRGAKRTLKRIGRPDDMDGTAIFLASRAGAFLTGAIIPVDGGIATVG